MNPRLPGRVSEAWINRLGFSGPISAAFVSAGALAERRAGGKTRRKPGLIYNHSLAFKQVVSGIKTARMLIFRGAAGVHIGACQSNRKTAT
ncbi:MAG TPA: hypothetical protein VFU02_22985 [Polyangiaceae bacterium]|nr:hypothetical protein [Polyangiaceae bacterium]